MSKMRRHILFFCAVIIIAYVMALFEIQIEGSNGWASNLPTWRITNINFFGIFGNLDKPITGYHVYLWLYSFLLTHLVFLINKWSLKKELYVLSFYIFFTTLEGMLRFAINPSFGISKFLSGEINWYNEPYMLYVPVEYWIRFGLAIVLYKLSFNFNEKKDK